MRSHLYLGIYSLCTYRARILLEILNTLEIYVPFYLMDNSSLNTQGISYYSIDLDSHAFSGEALPF